MSNSSTCVVEVVDPEEGAVLLPVALLVLSRVELAARPENSAALTARAATEGWVTLMVLPAASAATLCADKITVRTPFVPLPFAISASTL